MTPQMRSRIDITNKNSQNLFFHSYLQVIKFVLQCVQQGIEQEWAAHSFDYPLV